MKRERKREKQRKYERKKEKRNNKAGNGGGIIGKKKKKEETFEYETYIFFYKGSLAIKSFLAFNETTMNSKKNTQKGSVIVCTPQQHFQVSKPVLVLTKAKTKSSGELIWVKDFLSIL